MPTPPTAGSRLTTWSSWTIPEGAFPNYDAIILLSPETGADPDIVAALQPLVGAIAVEAMRAANLSVDRDNDKLSFAETARQLAARIGL